MRGRPKRVSAHATSADALRIERARVRAGKTQRQWAELLGMALRTYQGLIARDGSAELATFSELLARYLQGERITLHEQLLLAQRRRDAVNKVEKLFPAPPVALDDDGADRV